ncbi:MAG: hypothetical protein ABI456_08245 [Ktedonobacteraceae bacterium]
MTSIADGSVIIQTSSESVPSTPSWFGEVTLLIRYLHKHGVLAKIGEQVRFTRRCFGRDEVIDFLAVLFGYAISGERTLEAFYERLPPFAVPFMVLFERDHLLARSTLSRFLTALTEVPVDTLRTLFLDDLLSRPLSTNSNEKQTGDLMDRAGNAWMVFDLDGTREAARQRALPQTEDLPPPFRRLDDVCAAFLPRPQAWTSGANAHGHQSGPQLPMARLIWQPGQRSLPGGTAKGAKLPSIGTSQRTNIPRRGRGSWLDGQYGTGAVLAEETSP